MNELFRLDPALRDRAVGLLSAAGGRAPIVNHPFNYGLSEDEWWDNRRHVLANVSDYVASRLRSRKQLAVRERAYERRFRHFLDRCPQRLGFLFESVEQNYKIGSSSQRLQDHIAHLEQFDPMKDRIWIVIPTFWSNILPVLGAERFRQAITDPELREEMANLGLQGLTRWTVPLGLRQELEDECDTCLREAFWSMAHLGLRRPQIAGCYLLMWKGRFVPSDYAYSCINHLDEEMKASRFFEAVKVVRKATFINQLMR